MGYIVQINKSQANSAILSSSEAKAGIGLDRIGLPIVHGLQTKAFLELFLLEQNGEQDSVVKIQASELCDTSGQNLVSGSILSFAKSIDIHWREISFDIVYIPSSSFMLAKLARPDLLSASPQYQLECPEYKLDLPLFSGTNISIGSHSCDSVRICESGIKPRHALLRLSGSAAEPEISGCLGMVENRVESGIFIFKLLPCENEFRMIPLI